MGEAVSAATFGLPEDSVRVRLEVALIPPQARPLIVMCKSMEIRRGSSRALRAVGCAKDAKPCLQCSFCIAIECGSRQPYTLYPMVQVRRTELARSTGADSLGTQALNPKLKDAAAGAPH